MPAQHWTLDHMKMLVWENNTKLASYSILFKYMPFLKFMQILHGLG